MVVTVSILKAITNAWMGKVTAGRVKAEQETYAAAGAIGKFLTVSVTNLFT